MEFVQNGGFRLCHLSTGVYLLSMIRKIVLVALIIHSAITFYTCSIEGIFAPFPPFDELITYQVFSDLAISLGLVLAFLFYEVKRHSLSQKRFALCLVGTVLLGSFSPLIYILSEKKIFS